MAEEVMNSGKRTILTKVKQEPVSDDEVICEPVAKSPKRSDNLSECVVKKEPKDDVPAPATKTSSAKIKIAIKATKEKHTVKITKDATVKELKNEAARAFKMSVDKVCLIYSGKVLNDSDILSAIRIEDGHILHLIVKTNVARSFQKVKLRKRNFFMKHLKRDLPSENEKKRSAKNVEEKHQNPSLIGPNATIGIPNVLDPASSSEEEQNPTTTNISASPFGLGAFGGLPGLGTFGLGSPNFLEVQEQMQKELLQNPELLQEVMNNPFVQSMMENPEYMRQIVTSNPQMKEMLDKNPELSHMLNSPDVLRSTMEVAKNPVMLQELIRFRVENMPTPSGSQNSESINDNEENTDEKSEEAENESKESESENKEMENGTKESENESKEFVNGTKESENENKVSENESKQKDESEDKDGNKRTENECAVTKEKQEEDKKESKESSCAIEPPPSEKVSDEKNEEKTTEKISVEDKSSPSVEGGIFTSPGLQSIMQQMMQNPQLVQEMFNAPYMQSMMDALAANPEVASQIMVNNPVFGNNAALHDQMRQSLPAFIQQMQNPEMQRFVSNPQALSAMMNIHQGLDQLQQVAPNVFNMFPGQPPMPALFSPVAESNRVPTAPSEKIGTAQPNILTQDPFSFFMRNMVNSLSRGTNNDSPPEEKYRSQLEQMRMMGFANQQTNLQALIATFGDLNSAVERILSQAP